MRKWLVAALVVIWVVVALEVGALAAIEVHPR